MPGPLALLLKQQAIEVLDVQLKAMFDCADDTLFDWARRASGEEQHRCMSLMRMLRVQKPDVVERFFKSFVQQFDHPRKNHKLSDIPQDGELSMQPTDALEESIAITNMTARAEGLFRDPLFELGLRLDWAMDHCNERVESHPLEPRAIAEAFLEASRAIEMDIESRLVVLKLFERTVIIQLGDLYNRLLRSLDENGVRPASARREEEEAEQQSAPAAGMRPTQISNMLSALGALATPRMAPNPAAPHPGAIGNGYSALPGGPVFAPNPATGFSGDAGGSSGYPPPAMPPFAPGMAASGPAAGNPGVAPGTFPGAAAGGALPVGAYGLPLPQGYAAYAGYTDAHLASELAERLTAWMQKPQAHTAQEPIARRADLIDRMFDGFKDDAALPDTVKPVLETLRFPVLKAALADPGFLTNTEHPLRVLLRDLTTAATSGARVSRHDPTANLNALSQAMAPLLTPDAPVVRANIDQPEPVSEDVIQAFLGHMDKDAETRRKILVQRGIQRVDQELQRVTESRELLATAELLIDRALRPLLGLTLLRHSIVSPLWTQSLDMAKRVIHSVDLARAADFTQHSRAEVRDDLDDAMVLERIPRERHEEAISTLRALHDEIEAYLENRVPAPPKKTVPAAEPAPDKPLRDYLSLGAWFRVYNRKNSESRWMRLLEHEPGEFILFGGFDADNRLTISSKDFEEDLVSGRSEPLDPPPDFETALTEQRRKVSEVAAEAIAAAKARTDTET
ncbi:MAG: DUF1631 family protein [Stenotrophobium sp.]